IEFAQEPDNLETFRQVLDETLRSVNSDYDAKRQNDLALQAPIIQLAPAGTFHQWLRDKGKLGGQNKVPRLSNSREYLEEILELIKN
ncbi:MAG: GH3 auxin-responsive promoter family protein, partial [Bacteroidota bacterium]|nr:GH3 auxin-responsive promoter family protein [Bacteroidota bacterium]